MLELEKFSVIKGGKMLFKSSEAFYRLEDLYLEGNYQYDIPFYSAQKTIMPSLPSFKINYLITINDEPLQTSSFFTEYLMKSMESSRFWNRLQFKLETNYSKESTYILKLEDQLINQSILTKFGIDKFAYIVDFTVELKFYTNDLKLDELIKLLNYFHTSMIFTTLEFELPFVFNYYSRKLFADNFKYLASISSSLTNSNKLVDNLLKLIYNKQYSSATYLFELTNSPNKRKTDAAKLKKKGGETDHTLILFNSSTIDLKSLSQLSHILDHNSSS